MVSMPQSEMDQSPCEAYFNGRSGNVSFHLDGSPLEAPNSSTLTQQPCHFQHSVPPSFANAWPMVPHFGSSQFPLPTLLQSLSVQKQLQAVQKRSNHAARANARNRGGAETTRAKVQPQPQRIPLKRGFTAPANVASHIKPSKGSSCPKPSAPLAGDSVAGHVWSLSQDAQGCREVQDAIDAASSEEERLSLAMELAGHAWEALQCPHANHVVRKFITTMSAPSLQFLIDELVREGADVVRESARHRYGCRIVEALLKICTEEQMQHMVQHLLPEVADLSIRMYGNFVVQRILEHGTAHQRCYISQILQANLITTASNFYGSAVVGAALKYCALEDRVCLSKAIIEVNGLLGAILRFRHGQNIKEQMFEVLEESDQELAQRELLAPPMKAPRSDRTFSDSKPTRVSGPVRRAITEPATANSESLGLRSKAMHGA